MPSVYIETTIPSFYFSTRRSVQALAWRAATRAWWDDHRSAYDLLTSDAVFEELSQSTPSRFGPMAGLLDGIPLLPRTDVVMHAAESYMRQQLMPASAGLDAVHLASASVHKADFLLTWNCRHLANANKARHIEVINSRLGLHTPLIVTPYSLQPEVNE